MSGTTWPQTLTRRGDAMTIEQMAADVRRRQGEREIAHLRTCWNETTGDEADAIADRMMQVAHWAGIADASVFGRRDSDGP